MTGIDRYISELLFDHDCVILPAFGGFLTSYSGARIHPVKHSFYPPSRTVVFNANLRTNDGLLIDHVSRTEKISYHDASLRVNEYAARCMRELESGNTIDLINIGSFRMGRENNIIFDPDLSSNYLEDAFGLPSFVSPAIKRESVRQRLEKQLTPRPVSASEKKKRKLSPVLGWAAGISIPVAAAVLLYMFNPTFVNELGKEYASFVPTVRFSPAVPNTEPVTNTNEARFENFRHIAKEVIEKPAMVPEPEPDLQATSVHTLKKYQIVVGAFSLEANANKYVGKLRALNFDASVVGNNRNGLVRVGINGSDSKSEAISMMEDVRLEVNSSAWLLRIR